MPEWLLALVPRFLGLFRRKKEQNVTINVTNNYVVNVWPITEGETDEPERPSMDPPTG